MAVVKGEKGKKQNSPAETKNLPARREDKQTNKLPPAAVQAIIDLTLQGLAMPDIQQYVVETFKVSISIELISYYRRKHRDKMLAAIEDDIAAARAMYPDSALLVGRLATIDAATKKEMRKKRGSGYAIAALVGAAAQDVYKAEALRHRLQEFERRFPRSTDEDNERIMRELERRSHVLRNVTEEATAIGEIAGDNLDIEADAVVDAEVVQVAGGDDIDSVVAKAISGG